MSVVSQTAGPISRELRHDSDLRRLVAGGCDSEREREGREEGKGMESGGGGRNREKWRVSWMGCLLPTHPG